MFKITTFPFVTAKNFGERDKTCHSLIELALYDKFSKEIILLIIDYLNSSEVYKNDFVINTLFMKCIKKCKSCMEQSEIEAIVQLMKDDDQAISQYHIAFITLCDDSDLLGFRQHLLSQSWKLKTEEEISINGIDLPYSILTYLLKDEEIDQDNEIATKKYNEIYCTMKLSNIPPIQDLIANLNQYHPLDFWTQFDVPNDFTIDVKDNPFLFHAAACLSSKNPLIKIQYDIKNFKFPEIITYDLNKVIGKKPQIIKEYLEFEPLLVSNKNLYTLSYILLRNKVSLRDFKSYQKMMTPRSYLILSMIYSNYIEDDKKIFLILSISDLINLQNPRDIILARFYFSILKQDFIQYLNDKMKNLLYVAPKSCVHTRMNKICVDSKAYYGLLKKIFMNGDIRTQGKEKIFSNFKQDLSRFVGNAVFYFPLEFQLQIFENYEFRTSLLYQQVFTFLKLISQRNYKEARQIINNLYQEKEEVQSILKKETNIEFVRNFLCNLQSSESLEIISKFNLRDLMYIDELITIYFNINYSGVTIEIDRNDLLNSSMKAYKQTDIKNHRIKINYKNEKGIDHGGLSKDWFINVSNSIIDTGIFKLVPNGSSFTINEEKINKNICYFIGQLIGTAFNSQRNINIKFTSFVWKILLSEQITLEDMKNYDNEIYDSLCWISDNDPSDAMLTFVDSNDEELCPNGKDINVDDQNKGQYIKLLMKKKFLDKKVLAFEYILRGFKNSLDYEYIKLLDSETVKDFVSGSENIDTNDWKRNTEYDNQHAKYFNQFFEIIAKWSQPNLKKLLKFITGSSIVPLGGFKNFYSIGGKLNITFLNYDSELLPTAHTCSNSIVIPCYDSIEKFENKLLLAIQCEEFALA